MKYKYANDNYYNNSTTKYYKIVESNGTEIRRILDYVELVNAPIQNVFCKPWGTGQEVKDYILALANDPSYNFYWQYHSIERKIVKECNKYGIIKAEYAYKKKKEEK